MTKVAIIGGGAAGFFLAIHLKELLPTAHVVIFERAQRVLAKVKVSGGGRCNVTNSFAGVTDLVQVYPRGAKLLKRLFRAFSPADAYAWFEAHGVPLVTQEDECVFPRSQSSDSIILCLTRQAQRLGVEVRTQVPVTELERVDDAWRVHFTERGEARQEVFNAVSLTTGGAPHGEGHDNLRALGHEVATPCPSLFTFRLHQPDLTALMGIVVEGAQTAIAGTRFRGEGPLLITHWGLSGPAILKLSSQAARHLFDCNYQAPLLISWSGTTHTEEVAAQLQRLQQTHLQRQLGNVRYADLQARLWHYLLQRAGLSPDRPWGEVGRKGINRLANVLTADSYSIVGRGTYKEEFVTCGGVSLSSVDARTLESKSAEGLFFAGEVLDIDGVTGGFNFTAAWSTAVAAARGIAQRLTSAHLQPLVGEGHIDKAR